MSPVGTECLQKTGNILYIESHRDGMFIENVYIHINESRRDGMSIENGEYLIY